MIVHQDDGDALGGTAARTTVFVASSVVSLPKLPIMRANMPRSPRAATAALGSALPSTRKLARLMGGDVDRDERAGQGLGVYGALAGAARTTSPKPNQPSGGRRWGAGRPGLIQNNSGLPKDLSSPP
jgi:hypothetical protein